MFRVAAVNGSKQQHSQGEQMREVEPQVFLTHATSTRDDFFEYLEAIGSPDWKISGGQGDTLVEAAGRVCYRSWQPWNKNKPDCSNPNVEKVREGNKDYLANILKQGHGSVLEHINATMIFHNVSRIFTHELVRHRAGCSYSQESMRYVRLTESKMWIPPSVRANPPLLEMVLDAMSNAEEWMARAVEASGLSEEKSFAIKKAVTSALRRCSLGGAATTIMITANARAWRHILAMRGSPAAEEEMQAIMPKAAELLKEEWPNALQDMSFDENGFVVFEHPKV
jgi:thymidylate synthase (FAD)